MPPRLRDVPRVSCAPPMLIDTHCHLADPAYDADRAAVLERAWAAGVARVVVIGESPDGAERALGARRRPSPGSPRPPASTRTTRRAGARRARDWLRGTPAAIPRWSPPARWGSTTTTTTRRATRQRAAFEAQLALAREAGKPAVIHAREADDDVAAVLRGASRRSPPSCTRSAADPGSCGRGWTSATMCRSAGW